MSRLLIVTTDNPVSGRSGSRPRVDLTCLARRIPSQIRHIGKKAGPLGRIPVKAAHAWAAFRIGASIGRFSAILSTSEAIGLPLAAGLYTGRRRSPHILVTHRLHTPAQLWLLRNGILIHHIDRIVVVSRSHATLLRGHLPDVQGHKVVFVPHYVDEQFYHPAANTHGEYVLAVGQALRDYATLIPALAASRLPARILASSAWMPQGTRYWEAPLPPNVQRINRLSYTELWDLYAGARFVVIPLLPTVTAAGSTSALEAMAMGKAVIATHAPGIVDYVRHGVTGLLTPPADVPGLTEAIVRLWTHPDEAQMLGRAGREVVQREMGLDHYIECFVRIVEELEEARV